MCTAGKNKVLSLPIETQYFPFLPTFMKYILQNFSPKLLLKFYQCCKYFYFKLRITISSHLSYMNNKKNITIQFVLNYNTETIYFPHNYSNIEKLWLTDTLQICCYPDTRLIRNEFLNKIYRNNLKELNICSEFTLIKELEILCKSPNLIKIRLNTKVQNENGQEIPIEKIMILFPKLQEFTISPSYFTMKSFQKLSEFKFSNKFQRISLRMIKTEFDPISFCSFLERNFKDGADLSLTFDWDFRHLKFQLLPRIKKIINGWATKKPKYFLL